VSHNADTIRQGVESFNAFMRGELSSEAYAERYDPQVEVLWRDRQTFPDFPQQLRGLAEFIAFAEQGRDVWTDRVQELLEVIEVPDGRVVALVRQSGRGRQSAVPIVTHFFAMWTIRDGKVRKIEFFRHRDDALQAAGLGEWAMSANLDLVRSIYAAWECGDFSHADWAHPEIEYVEVEGPAAGSWTGLVGMAEAMRGWLSAWEDCRVEADEYRELDDERVLVLAHWGGRGKTSGLDLGEMSTNVASLFHVCDGNVTKLVTYADRARALTDLGIEE
jgi:ketosteroid isomerase-like protein